jgi:hypothetical protein
MMKVKIINKDNLEDLECACNEWIKDVETRKSFKGWLYLQIDLIISGYSNSDPHYSIVYNIEKEASHE